MEDTMCEEYAASVKMRWCNLGRSRSEAYERRLGSGAPECHCRKRVEGGALFTTQQARGLSGGVGTQRPQVGEGPQLRSG